VDGLEKHYPVRQGVLAAMLGRQPSLVRAVDGVSFSIAPGEVLGLAGESGCGKSTTGMAVLDLVAPTAGSIRVAGREVDLRRDRAAQLAFRRDVQIVFQNPFEALNPRFTALESVLEPIAVHFPGPREDQLARARRALERAGLTPADIYAPRYPHELSGGQLQRVAIARAIGVEPRILVADEPVSMLDVSIRAGILSLFRSFARELDMAILYISHDLSTMRYLCQNVAVMYLGRIVEYGPAEAVLSRPVHPYAQALMASVPVRGRRGRKRLALSGQVPNAMAIPSGCRFHPRCPAVMPICSVADPPKVTLASGQEVACHLMTTTTSQEAKDAADTGTNRLTIR
jgi:oligopeptide/dipeptide ABC transporter ATP-binding protein